ncbi:LytR/AlgR family response regulator transcription factor [Pedobacter nutrimenti]|uniref:LytTR family two component transcriptional regulator n=1 Tax=Pedobacter nutrimenti TaxID=1241337 RepID=A0A318UFQ7_9SPHI|nr:LytTR family DNA-binding domain-containing protein [Pedobacter nutrimenti]PYF72967.1 LytTR family two component transcriptional regulator [Pedobacter nutrimenti]
MKKIRCLLVDDEPLAINLLENHIAQLDFMEVVATCGNAAKAFDILRRKDIDLLFLDIQLPGISGIDFLKTLRNTPKTIMTTAYREFALDGYDLDLVDYLLKPITFDRFIKAVDRYLRNVDQDVLPMPVNTGSGFIFIKSGHKQIKVDLNEVLYIESIKDYIKLYTINNEVVAKYKISDMEIELTGKGFLRIHRSFIVNLKNITAFNAHDIEIGKSEIPIGESYKSAVLKLLRND